MTKRDALLFQSLFGTTWEHWDKEVIAADASSRRYFRLVGPQNQTVILVDAPPALEDYDRFLQVAKTLKESGLSVPQPLFEDHKAGVFVVTDLGTETIATAKERNLVDPNDLEDVVVDLLLALRQVTFSTPNVLNKSSATQMLDPLFDSYGASGQAEICGALADAFASHVTKEPIFSLRDFHAENVIWRADQSGIRQNRR